MSRAAPVIRIIECTTSDAAFAECFAIRLEVFVHEQNVPIEEERDEYDQTARHFLASLNGVPAGTARLILKPSGNTKIGRVAVRSAARGTGVGAALMRHLEAATNASIIFLDAQTHALPFYASLGYEAFGEAFMEASIPHRHMRKTRNHT